MNRCLCIALSIGAYGVAPLSKDIYRYGTCCLTDGGNVVGRLNSYKFRSCDKIFVQNGQAFVTYRIDLIADALIVDTENISAG